MHLGSLLGILLFLSVSWVMRPFVCHLNVLYFPLFLSVAWILTVSVAQILSPEVLHNSSL